MNFKIEINHLDVDNYPTVAKHFEEMASKSWLIDKIFMGLFFIYKKTEPQELEFSISPYKIETALARKSKTDLDEFHEVSRSVGWELATFSNDLHIYFKEKYSYAVPMHTDEEEEFNSIEIIAKRFFNLQYFTLPLLILFSFINISGLFKVNLSNSISIMKNGYAQIVILLIPLAILVNIFRIIDLKKFLKKNRQNVESGKPLEFNNSQQTLYKYMHFIIFMINIALVLFAIYNIFILKSTTFITVLIPVIIGLSLGLTAKNKIKSLNKSKSFKVIAVTFIVILAGILGASTSLVDFDFISKNENILAQNEYKVLSYNRLPNINQETARKFSRNTSFLIPQSYNYISLSDQNSFLSTEYSKAITKSVAENLVQRYKLAWEKNSSSVIRGQYSHTIEMAIESGSYNLSLEEIGFSEQDFDSFKNKEMTEAMDHVEEMFLNKSIVEDNTHWNLDEVIFLTYEKDAVIIREGNEVFFLRGPDFSDPTIISRAKKQLNLN